MKKLLWLTMFVLLVMANHSFAEWHSINSGLRAEKAAPVLTVPSSNIYYSRVEVELSGIEIESVELREGTFQKVSLPNTGLSTEIGDPELPMMMAFIAIPDVGDVRLNVVSADYVTIPDVNVFPVQATGDLENPEPAFVQNSTLYRSENQFPAEIATVGDPMIMRDFRVVPLIINPTQYNPSTNELRVYSNIEVEVVASGDASINPKIRTRPTISRAFEKVYQNMIANYDHLRDNYSVEDGSYLLIMPEAYAYDAQQLIDWRRRQGYRVEVRYMENIAEIMEELNEFIQEAYDTWEYPPEYVILLGDEDEFLPERVPTYFHSPASTPVASDHIYSLVEGDDYLADIFVGRLSVRMPIDVDNICNKIVKYESEPYMEDDTDWFNRGLMVAGGFPRFVVSTVETKNWVRQEMLEYGYSQVDTVYDWAANIDPENVTENINNSLNNGVGIVNYRGWANHSRWNYPLYDLDEISELTNGEKMPVVFSIVCGTGNFVEEPSFGEEWLRAGSSTNPRGGVGFFGSSYINTHTKWNNPLDGGIFEGLLHRDMRQLGEVTLWGKMIQYMSFPGASAVDCEGPDTFEHCVSFYHYCYNLLGDPAMPIWTKTPQILTVSYPTTVPVGQNFIDFEVTGNNGAAADAHVALVRYNGDDMEIHSTAITDASGCAALRLPNDATVGEVLVTVTKNDCKPHLGTLNLTQQPYQATVSEASPAVANPGQTLTYTITLQNRGTNNLNGVSAILSTTDEYVTINSNSANYGNIATGQSVNGDFEITIHSDALHNRLIRFDLEISDNGGHTFSDQTRLLLEGVQLVVSGVSFEGDPYLEPGETSDLTLTVRNVGGVDAVNVQATLSTQHDEVSIIDDAGSFGNIAAGGSASNSDNTFRLSVDADLFFGAAVHLLINFSDDNGIDQNYHKVVQVGELTPSAPYGGYPYFAYDDSDIVSGEYAGNVPTYDWVEIDPAYGGAGETLNLNDEFTVGYVEMPFDFQFYGEDFDRLNISPNGWITFTRSEEDEWWNHELTYQYNAYVYSPLAPTAAVAVYWDDLHPEATFVGCPENIGSGDVFYYQDSANNRLIVEWSRIEKQQGCSAADLGPLLTFQVILYDPDHYATETGDGEILCQYHTVSEGNELYDQQCTIGLINHRQRNFEDWQGLQCLFDSYYRAACAPLADGRAIKFTTNGSLPTSAKGSTELKIPSNYALYPSVPNPFNPSTTISYHTPEATYVHLSVYDASGKRIKTIVNKRQDAGIYSVQWNGRNEAGGYVPSGVYIYRLETENYSEARRMVLLK